MKKSLALFWAATLLLSLIACGAPAAEEYSISSGEVPASLAQDASISETQAPEVSEEPEPEPELSGAELEIHQREGADIIDLRDEYTQWADEIMMESLQKLVNRGAIEPLRDEESIWWKIPFAEEGDDLQVAFLDDAAREELTQPLDRPVAQVILELDGYVKFRSDNQEDGIPWFTPKGYKGTDEICELYADRFSDTMADCDYLIWIDGCLSRRDEEYYFGGVDRWVITTLVIIVDAKEKEILHIENLGTDTPGNSVKLPGGSEGETNWEGAWAYLADLFAQSGTP